jgi:uncharacterized membrane protein YcaP (DUF421 family)
VPYASERAVTVEAWIHRLGLVVFIGTAVLGAAGYLGDRAAVVVHAVTIYLFLLLVFRVAGRRTLAQTTTFDLVLILIIGDATQQALLGEDASLGSAAVAILTLVALDTAMSHLKCRFPLLDRLLEGDPILLVENGVTKEQALRANGLDHEDVASAARTERGITRLSDVQQATLEKDGKISIVSRRKGDL